MESNWHFSLLILSSQKIVWTFKITSQIKMVYNVNYPVYCLLFIFQATGSWGESKQGRVYSRVHFQGMHWVTEGKTRKQEQVHWWGEIGWAGKGIGYKASSPAPSEPTSPPTLHLLKGPQSYQTAPVAGDRVCKHMRLCGHFTSKHNPVIASRQWAKMHPYIDASIKAFFSTQLCGEVLHVVPSVHAR